MYIFPRIVGEHCLSDASLERVADLVRWYLPIRTLVKFKLVNKEWRTWCDENLSHLANVRRKDESEGWYFPIAVDLGGHCSLNPRPWCGLHQWTKELHALPDLNFLRPYSLKRDRALPVLPVLPGFKLEATSHGLLLLSRVELHSIELIVCNPLRKKWRKLPRHSECCDKGMVREYLNHSVQMHLVVDDLFKKYDVIRVFKERVNTYISSSNRWVCSLYARNAPAFYTACFNGCVYIMEEQCVYIMDVVSGLSTRIDGVPPGREFPSGTRKNSEYNMAYTPTLDLEP